MVGLAKYYKRVNVASKEHLLKVWQTLAHVSDPSKKFMTHQLYHMTFKNGDLRTNNLG
jgi:hypothetical protein